jgi:hypothetical protein
MHFLVDDINKIIFCWSPKCACTHIKNIYWCLKTDDITYLNQNILTISHMNKLPNDIENYTTLIFIRNPYKRIISGFLDKYKTESQYRTPWKEIPFTFNKFVDELIKKNWCMVDYHHFTPQMDHFDQKIFQSKSITLNDIENINYEYIEKIYGKKIPESILNKKYGHERFNYIKETEFLNYSVYDLNIDEYINFNVDIKYFYNEEIKNKIFEFYKNDFIFFYQNGFDYINIDFLNT